MSMRLFRQSIRMANAVQRAQRVAERHEVAIGRAALAEANREARQAAKDYAAEREAESVEQCTELDSQLAGLRSTLGNSLTRSYAVDFGGLRVNATLPTFDPRGNDVAEDIPKLNDFLRFHPSFLERKVAFFRERYEKHADECKANFEAALNAHKLRNIERKARLEAIRETYRRACDEAESAANSHNSNVELFETAYKNHTQEAVVDYFTLVFDGDELPGDMEVTYRVAYVPDSQQLVIEQTLPTVDVVPPYTSFRYVKKTDQIEPVNRKPVEIRSIYADLLAQLTLRTLRIALAADSANSIKVITYNGIVDTVDPRTGNEIRPTLISLTSTKDNLLTISFDRVEPIACLRNLKASISRSAHELEPVRPLVDFDMVDRRFIDKSDILTDLDTRPNLADLSPNEFEALMTNLFEKMGLETRLTQSSRDGGVDCVAWDMRPVIGGKVVIQAKRYKNTVGVSAVRDLFGTMMNEGAAKGILVATSGYGQSAYEFAKNKPIELITGSNLLSMLLEYAGIQAKIDFPQDWEDSAHLA